MKKTFTMVVLSLFPLSSYAGVLDSRFNQVAEVNGVMVTANDNIVISSANPTTSEMRIFLDGVISELGEDRVKCRQTPHINVFPENWSYYDSNRFGADIEWRADLYSVKVGHKSFRRAAKEVRELCAYSVEQSHILDFFENSGIKLKRNFVAGANQNQTLSFITNLYTELIRLEASGKTNVTLEITKENGRFRSEEYSFFGADISEETRGGKQKIAVGHKSYKKLAELLISEYLKATSAAAD